MRSRGTWLLGIVGGLGGFLTWVLSEPYAHTAQEHGTKVGYNFFTLGSFYGWFSHYLLGALIAGFLAIVMTISRAGFGRALLGGIAAAMIGGAITCGADAACDWFGIQFAKGPDGGLAAGLLVPMVWHLVVATAIALSVAMSSYPTPQRMRQALLAGLGAAIASYFARDLFSSLDASKQLVNIDISKIDLKHPESMLASMDVWKPWATDRLISHVTMGLVVGLAMGFADAWSRAAWLRHEAGRNEGRDFPLYAGQNRIGSAEGLEVSLRGDLSVAALHAVLQPYQGHWLLSDVSGAGMAVNGFPTQTAYLNEGDVVQLGQSALRFHFDSRRRRAPASVPIPMPMPVQPIAVAAPVVEAPVVRVDPRLLDPFGQVHSIPQGSSILGRGADAQIKLDFDPTVSRQHAMLMTTSSGVMLRPLSQRSVTTVNGNAVVGDTPLKDGDQIKVGGTLLTIRF